MLTITLDPNDHYTPRTNHNNIAAHCSVIMGWALNPNFDGTSFKVAILQQYLYGSDFAMGGTVDSDGVYKYPEDPDLHPLMKITRGDDILYFYAHDIIAMKDDSQKSGFYITRVD